MLDAHDVAWAAWRAAFIGFAAALLAPGLARVIQTSTARSRRWLITALVLPLATPALLVGYAYTDFGALIVRPLWQRELAYAAVLLARLLPVAVLVLACVPAAASDSSLHCDRLLDAQRRPAARRAALLRRLAMRGGAAALLAGLLIALLAFTEFELATFFAPRHWTVDLFDAQAGGQDLAASLRAAASPTALIFVLLVWMALRGTTSRTAPHANARRASAPPMRRAAWIYACAALLGLVLIPFVLLLQYASFEWGTLNAALRLQKELLASLVFGLAATVLLVGLSGWIVQHRRAALLLLVPGCLGALLLALVLVGLFQVAPLRPLYDTPLPLLFGLVLCFLPHAVILRWALTASVDASSRVHTAQLLRGSPDAAQARSGAGIAWRLRSAPYFWMGALLFLWTASELTLASLLAPATMSPAAPRMYNFMHYGRSEVLSLMLMISILGPFGLVLLARVGLPRWRRLHV